MKQSIEARDFRALTKGILDLCEPFGPVHSPFGPVHSFKLVHNRSAGRVACLIELQSVKQQPALARAIGARTINGSVCLEIEVGPEFEATAQQHRFEARVAAR